MTHLFQKFALTAAAATAAIVVNVNPAQAFFVDLNGSFDSGDLAGATYDGSFSFDTVNPGGTSDVNALNLDFSFDNTTSNFTEADAIGQPLVEFDFDGNLLGLEFAVDNASLGNVTFDFQFTPGFFSPEEAAVFYDIENGNGGSGDVTLASTDVPEPSMILGSGMALGFGALFKRKKSKNREDSASK